jgi:hypothetical protein
MTESNPQTTHEQPVQRYHSTNQFCARNPAFTAQAVYTLIFNQDKNGLRESGAVLRIGRKILIDEAKFFAWVRKINGITD